MGQGANFLPRCKADKGRLCAFFYKTPGMDFTMTSTPFFRPVANLLVAAGLIAAGALPWAVGQVAAQSNPMRGPMMQGSMMGRPDGAADQAGAQSKPGEAPAISAELIKKGREIANTVAGIGCTGCHGTFGEGDVGIGPYIRGVDLAKVQATIAGVNQMAFLQEELTAQETEAVSAYFSWLGSLKLVKTLVKRGRILPQSVEVQPGTGLQLIISNASTRPFTFSAKELGMPDITIGGREDKEIILAVPEKEGKYEIACRDCQSKTLRFTVTVTRAAETLNIPEASAPYLALLPDLAENGAPKAPEAPTPADAPSREDLIAKGRDIFLHVADVGCVACHGSHAEGDVGIGPFNRGMDETAIRAALERVEAMQFLRDDLTEDGIEQIAAYYERMGELRLIKTHLVRGRFFPDRIEVKPGEEIQLVVVNRDHNLATVTVEGMGIDPYSLPGLGEDDRIWTAPKTPGEFKLRCVDCETTTTGLTVVVSGT